MYRFLLLVATLPLFLWGDDITWESPPTVISNLGEDASDPQIATDEDGDTVAVWVAGGYILASYRPIAGGWEAVQTVSGSGSSNPSLVMDSSGNATVVWIESGVAKAASLPFEGSWSGSTILSLSGAADPHIGVDADGDVVAVWARSGNIETAQKDFGGSWPGLPDAISSTSASNPRVALGGAGANTEVVVVWHGDSGTDTIYASNRLIGDVWNAETAISDTDFSAHFPDVTVDSDGNAHAVWYRYSVDGVVYSEVTVHAASLPFSSDWSEPVSISDRGFRDPTDLKVRIGCDASGNAIAVWLVSMDDAKFGVQSSVLEVGDSWTPFEFLEERNVHAYSFGFSVNSFGNAFIAYMTHNALNTAVEIQTVGSYLGNVFDNQVFSAAQTLSTGTKNGFPVLAAAYSGGTTNNVAVAWVDYNGSNNVIHAVTGTGEVVSPVTSASVDQDSTDFNVFTEYFNTLTWTDSATSNVVSYAITRNGQFLGKVEPDVMTYVDDNRHSGESSTYTITAIDNQGFGSEPVTLTYP